MRLILTFLLGVVCGGIGVWQIKPDATPSPMENAAPLPAVATRQSPTPGPSTPAVRSKAPHTPSPVAPALPSPHAAPGTTAQLESEKQTHAASGWRLGGTDAPEKRYFGLALYSRDESPQRQGALNQRIQYRSRQMQQTLPRP
ncbi:hypothetical protein QEG98_33645 [Myxococcus sp. MxC21-1]|uniref:hypothetical protein n=1 Tax=Myxococcus sp. MxC21-1 TaxID=3041439 RepID=UPI0029306263|nr:hypothetical protein [Myxococcus sp. MxC21-1]WNZ60834.1 hypothetical protein QEG98_33645 [Myxococcus sp. MxC21-1]